MTPFITILITMTILPGYMSTIITTDQFLYLTSNKNIHNIQISINKLTKVTKDLDKVNTTASNICKLSLKGAQYTAQNEYDLLYSQAVPVHKDPKLFNRFRRGLRPLGNLVSFLTDLPSPNQWDQYQDLVKHLKKIQTYESYEINEIEHSIIEEKNFIKEFHESITDLTKKQNHLSNEIKNNLLVNALCIYGQSLVQIVNRELNSCNFILQDAKYNLPNKHMFPPKKIEKELINYSSKNYPESPILQILSDSNVVYTINSAVTAYHEPYIKSILSIPIISETQTQQLINYNFTPKNQSRLEPFEKFLKKKIDIIICNSNLRKITLLASADLNKCQHPSSEHFYVCRGREVTMRNIKPYNCSTNELPKVIVIQLKQNEFLIEGTAGQTHLICKNQIKEVQISRFTKVKVPNECTLENIYFNIEKSKTPEVRRISNRLEILEMNEIDTDQFIQKKQNTNATKKDFDNKYNDLTKTITEMNKSHNKTKHEMDYINYNQHAHNIVTYTSVGLAGITMIVLIILLIINFSKKHTYVNNN